MPESYEYPKIGTDRISYEDYFEVHGVRSFEKRRDVRIELKGAKSDGRLVIYLKLDEATGLYKALHPICVP